MRKRLAAASSGGGGICMWHVVLVRVSPFGGRRREAKQPSKRSLPFYSKMDDLSTAQLGPLVKEWVALRADLEALSAAVREKRKRVKVVREVISKIMKGNKLGQLKISAGAVRQQVKKTKAPLSKKYLLSTLTEFFEGNAELAAKCAAFLDEHRPMRTTENLTLEAPSE